MCLVSETITRNWCSTRDHQHPHHCLLSDSGPGHKNRPRAWREAAGGRAASLASHFIIDLIPHGFIAHPNTIFKKFIPTFFELAPALVIMLFAMAAFGSPLLFLWAVGFSIIPDVVTILIWKGNDQVAKVPGLSLIHSLHREVHWFETENPDGTVTYLFPNRPMLALEALLILCLLLVLFIPLKP